MYQHLHLWKYENSRVLPNPRILWRDSTFRPYRRSLDHHQSCTFIRNTTQMHHVKIRQFTIGTWIHAHRRAKSTVREYSIADFKGLKELGQFVFVNGLLWERKGWSRWWWLMRCEIRDTWRGCIAQVRLRSHSIFFLLFILDDEEIEVSVSNFGPVLVLSWLCQWELTTFGWIFWTSSWGRMTWMSICNGLRSNAGVP